MIHVEVEGLRDLERGLDRVQDVADDAPDVAAKELAKTARSNAPVFTGELAGSFNASGPDVTSNVRYWPFPEFGPPRAQRYIGRSVTHVEKWLPPVVEKEMERVF